MELFKITIDTQSKDRTRLCGHVRYDDCPLNEEIYWYDVPESFKNDLSSSGNPWLAILLPLAMKLGESLSICLPVDSLLQNNALELMSIWVDWYPWLKKVPLEFEVKNSDFYPTKKKKTMAFFSGGIDSYFTLYHDMQGSKEIDELIFVWGFDIETDNRDSFFPLYNKLRNVSENLGMTCYYVATNIKETRLSQADWAKHYHGAAISSVALSLENRYKKALISSSHMESLSYPWGSTSLTDPLFSTTNTKIVHYGGKFNRVEKTKYISQWQECLESLKVCGVSRSDKNCSWCDKCYRTMLAFDLLGVLEKCSCFDINKFNIGFVSKVFLPDENFISFFNELRFLAIEKNRMDAVKAIDNCIARSRKLSKYVKFTSSLKKIPFIWRFSEPATNWILKNSI